MGNRILEKTKHGVQYTASIPERIIRALAAIFGGLLKEASDFLVPKVFKETTTYRIFIGNLLRYAVENIGRVEGAYSEEGKMDNEYGVKKMVGNSIEMVGIVAISASPLWILAFLSDAIWGVKSFFNKLAEELDREDLFEEKVRFEKRGDFLDSVQKLSDSLATNIDTPPLSKKELIENYEELKIYFRDVGKKTKMSLEDIRDLWGRLESAAAREDRSLSEISGAVTVHVMNRVKSMKKQAGASVKVTSAIVHEHILDYYRDALQEISDQGYLTVVKNEFAPYVKSAWTMFSPEEKMLTERILSMELVEFFSGIWEKEAEKIEQWKEARAELRQEKREHREERKQEKLLEKSMKQEQKAVVKALKSKEEMMEKVVKKEMMGIRKEAKKQERLEMVETVKEKVKKRWKDLKNDNSEEDLHKQED